MDTVELLLSQCKTYIDIPKHTGGQSAGMMTHPSVIEHIDLGIKISINYHKSQYKNNEIAKTLMELAILELIK